MRDGFRDQCRAYGLARLAAARECRTPEDWETQWKPNVHPFPIEWGDCWKAVIELKVADFPAEVGFFIDILGFDINAFMEEYAMLMTPEKEYTFSLLAAGEGEATFDPDTVSLQFMVRNIDLLCAELARRGISFESSLIAEWGEASPMRTSELRSPNGLRIKLWGPMKAQG